MVAKPPTRSVVSCSANEIRRDATTAVEALDGLLLAVRREAVHGRAILRNQHVTSGLFAPLWRLSEDLQSRGFRLSGVKTLNLIGIPEGLTPEQDRELRSAYLDLCAEVIEIDGPQADRDGLFPHVGDDLLSRFADVVGRLQNIAGSLAAPSAGGAIEPAAPAVESPRASRTPGANPIGTAKRRDGSQQRKVRDYFDALRRHSLERLKAGETPEFIGENQKAIAQRLNVSEGTVSRVWNEVREDRCWRELINRGLIPWARAGRGRVKPLGSHLRSGFRMEDGRIDALDGDRPEPDDDR